MRYISASAMPFNRAVEQQSSRAVKHQMGSPESRRLSGVEMGLGATGFVWVLAFGFWLLGSVFCSAELIDRVTAYVDDTAITLREFNEYYNRTIKVRPDITKEEALNTLINRVILLKEAKKLKIEAPTEDELLNEYIELKVKAFIRIREEDIRAFYDSHISEFRDLSYESARDRIEDYLVELEFNRLLKRHIDELRSSSYIKIN